ncbi:transcription factor [Fusarium langsethiae]|uniref:Transcription factor n=1 Tax=Fusarium langsethiae TaxID=179993 RepID=A0A0N0V5C1_FUSLA|nr:transcription factor [Fusarium langsethiae]
MTISSHGQNSFPAIHVSQEIALFLFEIFFERNYQSNLLFYKGQLIQDYIAGKACNNVVLAIFAFASLLRFYNPFQVGYIKVSWTSQSLENSRFEGDCWASVERLPLPGDEDEDDSPTTVSFCLDKNGSLSALPGQEKQLSFNSVLVMVQGLWWECQQFARSIHSKKGSPAQWTATYCSLDQRLQSLPCQIGEHGQPILLQPINEAPPRDLSRTFSLKYMYELCLLYLYSSVVPVLSCRREEPFFSRSLLQLAAEQAWERCKTMTAMTEQYLSTKAPISKLWSIVGYGAYVCVAVQLRRYHALGSLTQLEFQRALTNFRLTSELCRYWIHLRPISEDMERQFAESRTLTGLHEVEKDIGNRQDKPDSLIDHRNSDTSPALSSFIRSYVASNDKRSNHVGEGTPLSTSSGVADQSKVVVPQDQRVVSTTIAGPTGEDGTTEDPSDTDCEMRLNTIWWDQSPGVLGELFGNEFLLLNDINNAMYID